MGMCCNNNNNCGSIFAGYQSFWIIVVIAIVIIWVHQGRWNNGCCNNCNNNCANDCDYNNCCC